jgi:DNA polymerase III subunit beta
MKIDFNRASLAAALAITKSVVPSRTAKPILQSLLLRVSASGTVLIGTDSEITIRNEVPDVNCEGTGEVLLPAARVSEVISEMKDERVTIDASSDVLQLRGCRGKFNIPTANPADYPTYESELSDGGLSIQGSQLRRMIRRTIFATDVSNTNFNLTGVLFEVGTDVAMVATDSRRLSLIRAPLVAKGGGCKPCAHIVPVKALSLIERITPDSDEPVHLSFNASRITATTPAATITARLSEGRFPRYKDVIPRSHEISVSLIVGALYGAVRQALIFTDVESRGVDIRLSTGLMTLMSQGGEIGNSEVDLPIAYDGADFAIRLDPRFIADYLKLLPPESQIDLRLGDDETPAVFVPEDGSTYVIMPLSREG